jgi:hypothetical protein
MNTTTKYFGEFENREDVQGNFQVPDDDMPSEEDIIFAAYDIDGYEGFALVLFVRNEVLYEVNGSHCSCNGLEEQWDPEATTWKALEMRSLFNESPERMAALEAARKLVE